MNNQSYSSKLKAIISMGINPLVNATNQLFQHENFINLFPSYLLSLHWMVRASIPLMKEAIIYAEEKQVPKLRCEEFIAYLNKHCIEETDHDKWLLEDLRYLGISPEDVEKIIPSITVANLVGSQYYWIKHFDPISLIGYIAVIEGNSLSEPFLQNIKKSSDIPIQAFRTIDQHSKIDKQHANDLYGLVDCSNLDSQQFALIRRSALTTIKHATKLLDDIILGHVDLK